MRCSPAAEEISMEVGVGVGVGRRCGAVHAQGTKDGANSCSWEQQCLVHDVQRWWWWLAFARPVRLAGWQAGGRAFLAGAAC